MGGGDSGGPLILVGDSVAEDSLVGLVQSGPICNAFVPAEEPGVYVRISYLYNWIVDSMCLLNPDGVPEYVDCNSIVDGDGGGVEIPFPMQSEEPTDFPTTDLTFGFDDDFLDDQY